MWKFLPNAQTRFTISLQKSELTKSEKEFAPEIRNSVLYGTYNIAFLSREHDGVKDVWLSGHILNSLMLMPSIYLDSLKSNEDDIVIDGFLAYSSLSKSFLCLFSFIFIFIIINMSYEMIRNILSGSTQVFVKINGEPTYIDLFPDFFLNYLFLTLGFIFITTAVIAIHWHLTQKYLLELITVFFRTKAGREFLAAQGAK